MNLGWFWSRYSAPSIAAFGENSPQGSGRDAARFRRARDGPSENPRQKREAQDKGGIPDGLSFGDFSLAKQRKVTRLSGRDPTPKHPSRQRHTLFKES